MCFGIENSPSFRGKTQLFFRMSLDDKALVYEYSIRSTSENRSSIFIRFFWLLNL